MSNFVNQAYVQQYSTNQELLVQQRMSRLSSATMEQSFNGKAASVVEQFGIVEMTEILTRHDDTKLVNTPQAKRWARPRDFSVSDMVDDEDLNRMLINPTSSMAKTFAAAAGRKKDNLILEAMFTDKSKTGEDGLTDVTFANDGGVEVDSSGTDPMTVDKLREAMKSLRKNNVDTDNEKLFVAMTAEQLDDMLKQTQAINLDYSNTPKLEDGRITRFMGFNFIHTEELNEDSNGKRLCPAWAQSGVVMGTWGSMTTTVDRIPTKNNNLQILTKGHWGATRTQGEKIIKIVCDEP